jgi:hypothetical protein
VLRIGGRRYKVLLTRDDDPTLPGFARPEVERKYGAPPPTDAGVLFFRVEPRTERARGVESGGDDGTTGRRAASTPPE